MELDQGLSGVLEPRPVPCWANFQLRLVLLDFAEYCTEEDLLATWVRGIVPLQPNHNHSILGGGSVAVLTHTQCVWPYNMQTSTRPFALLSCQYVYRFQLLQNGCQP